MAFCMAVGCCADMHACILRRTAAEQYACHCCVFCWHHALQLLQEYKFQVQVPGKGDEKLLTVGRADLDFSLYVLAEGTAQSKMIPVLFKVGAASTGYLRVTITAEEVGLGSDDGMTEVSGMTGLTTNMGEEQDLSGAAGCRCNISVVVPAPC